jgi:hypothetical protein
MRARTAVTAVVMAALFATGAATAAVGPPVMISGSSPFPSGCSGFGNAHGSEVETSVAVNPADPLNAVAAWQQDRIPSGGSQGTVGAFTRDGGATWSRFVVPKLSVCSGGTRLRATDPWAAFGGDGTAYIASLSYDGDGAPGSVVVSRSTDGGETWGDPITIVSDTGLIFNDKEALTVDPLDPLRLYVVWARIVGGVSIVTFVSQSIDGGLTWLPAVPIWGPVGSLGGQGNQIAALGNGLLVNVYTEFTPGLYVIKAMPSAGGIVWGPGIPISRVSGSEGPSGAPVPIRAGGWIPAVGGGAGQVVVAWADGPRVMFSRTTDGVVWSLPRALVSGSDPMFTPEVAIAPDGTIGVTYYDLRNDGPGGGVSTDVWFSSSADGGATWNEQHVYGPFDLTAAPFSPGRGYFLGDYEGLDGSSASFTAVFAAASAGGGSTDVYAARITP